MSTHQDDHPDAEPGRAAPAPLLYKTGSERDQQVRARLAELGVSSGPQMEEVLRQLAEANTAALGPNRPAPPEDDSVPGPRTARVVRERPGDDNWQVEARAYQGTAAAQPKLCAGENVCPWRRDAPAGQFPPAVFEHSAPGNRTAGPRGRFGCHSSPPERALLCAGWLLAGADGNTEVVGMMDSGVLARPKLPDGVELYGSYAEMAIANGVDPDLPALYAGPVPDEDGADIVSLRRFIEDHYALEAAEWAEDLEHELKRSMPPGALLLLDCDGTALKLKLLGVEADHRGQGHTTRVMARISAEADARELAVVCTPTHKHGADRAPLEGLFRRYGFAPAAPEDRLTTHSWQRPPTHLRPPGGVAANTVRQLRAGLDFYRPLAPDSHCDWHYPTFADLVLAHGRLYAPTSWPGGPQHPGQCFAAAHALADREGWTYCEGYVLVPSSAGPVPHGAAEHAWCLTDEGQVADPALPDGHAALYWGLPLAETFRAEHRRTRGDDAVLTYGTDPFRAQLNEVLRAELPTTALAPPHAAAQTLQET